MLCFYPLSSYSSLNCVWIDIPQTWTWKISEPFCSVLVLAILTLYLLGIILIPQFAVSHCTAVYPSPHYICINCLCCPFPFYMFSLMVVCLPALIFFVSLFSCEIPATGLNLEFIPCLPSPAFTSKSCQPHSRLSHLRQIRSSDGTVSAIKWQFDEATQWHFFK